MIGTGQCLLKYNYKGGQYESAISPIKLKQLFVPFMILICGYLLACFQFLRELMHAHFEKQMKKVDSTPVVVAGGGTKSPSRDPNTSISPEPKPTREHYDALPLPLSLQ